MLAIEDKELSRAGNALAGLSVLYVEDEPELRLQTSQALGRWVRTVVTAGDGEQGLRAFTAERPDLVITDVRMPVMDGLTMAARIRAADPDIPIIVITAFDSPEFMMRAIEASVDTYVIKPVDGDRLHKTLRKCAENLQARAALARLRTLELQAMAKRHQEAIGFLARGLAHDYNNLLQGILGSMSMARELAEPGGAVRSVLDLAEPSMARARDLGQRLTLLARGGVPPSRLQALEPLLRETLRDGLAGTGIEAEWAVQGDLPPVLLDPFQMKEALTQVVRNAVEAMPGGGRLRLGGGVHRLAEGEACGLGAGLYLELRLQDSGPGIAEENLERIFEAYFTTKSVPSVKGCGLGLAVCAAVIRAHGGGISAESGAGAGATLRILLPVPVPVPEAGT
jgi:signal transduction histidine kinase